MTCYCRKGWASVCYQGLPWSTYSRSGGELQSEEVEGEASGAVGTLAGEGQDVPPGLCDRCPHLLCVSCPKSVHRLCQEPALLQLCQTGCAYCKVFSQVATLTSEINAVCCSWTVAGQEEPSGHPGLPLPGPQASWTNVLLGCREPSC